MAISAYSFRHKAHFITPALIITSNDPSQSISRKFRLYFLQIQHISTNPCQNKLFKATNFKKKFKNSRSFQLRKFMAQCKELVSTLSLQNTKLLQVAKA